MMDLLFTFLAGFLGGGLSVGVTMYFISKKTINKQSSKGNNSPNYINNKFESND